MKKKNIKIVNKDYELNKKLGELKVRLKEDVDDGKILAKITTGCAITTIFAMLTSIVCAAIGSLPVFTIISFTFSNVIVVNLLFFSFNCYKFVTSVSNILLKYF